MQRGSVRAEEGLRCEPADVKKDINRACRAPQRLTCHVGQPRRCCGAVSDTSHIHWAGRIEARRVFLQSSHPEVLSIFGCHEEYTVCSSLLPAGKQRVLYFRRALVKPTPD